MLDRHSSNGFFTTLLFSLFILFYLSTVSLLFSHFCLLFFVSFLCRLFLSISLTPMQRPPGHTTLSFPWFLPPLETVQNYPYKTMQQVTLVLETNQWDSNRLQALNHLLKGTLVKTRPYTRQPLSRRRGRLGRAVMSWAGAVVIWVGAMPLGH